MSEEMVERLALAMMAYADTLKASSRDAPFIRSHRLELARAVVAEIEKDHVIVPNAEMQHPRDKNEVRSDRDIHRAAKLLIDQHGADSGLRAAERADQLLDAGDMIGAATWRRILKAIEELGRGRREGDAVN